MITIGLVGLGSDSKTHIEILNSLPDFNLVGLFDPYFNSRNNSPDLNIATFNTSEELFNKVDAIDIPNPTNSFYDFTVKALKRSKHVFLESSLTNSMEEAEYLKKLALEANVTCQVGQAEKYNPAFHAAKSFINNPSFIDIKHHLVYSSPPVSNDLLNTLVNDINIIFNISKSNIKKIIANGIPVRNSLSDIINARIEFDNGCAASMIINHISEDDSLECRIYQPGMIIMVDFKNRNTVITRIRSNNKDLPEKSQNDEVSIEKPEIQHYNTLNKELTDFQRSIQNLASSSENIENENNALFAAHQILEILKRNS